MNKTHPPLCRDPERVLNTHGDSLYRLCLVLLKNRADAEDALQEVLLKYLQKAPAFQSPGHEKAWLMTVCANQCRDLLRSRARHPEEDISSLPLTTAETGGSGILNALLELPEKYRLALTLHYVEGYSVQELAAIIGKTPSAAKMRLQTGRRLLKELYEKEYL